MEEGKHEDHIVQKTMTLPYFDYEVPVLYLQDESSYIPVIELCKMLGLRADIHIPRWRKLVLWTDARKLPYQTSHRGRRIVWCLPGGALLFWFSCFNWSHVLPERRVQLQQATDEGTEVLAQAHEKMMTRYKSIRQQLFAFLTACADIETTLPQFAASLQSYLDDFDDGIAWEDLISQGKALISEATTHARSMLRDQAEIPVVDAMKINSAGEVVEELALPLFPIVHKEDAARFFEQLQQISLWHQHMMDFLKGHGIIWDEERKKWHLA
jgi:hypothetical protein